MGRHFSIELPDELAASVDRAVGAGHYASADDAISAAVAGWAIEAEVEGPDIETLRRLWQEGVDSGPGEGLSIEDIKRRARERHRGK